MTSDLQEGTSPRRGDWMTTATGRKVWPLDLRPDEVDLEDIAIALSNLCRFGGRCRQFYSVAQHSLWVADQVKELRPELELCALLHDAAEAYVGDVVSPIKPWLGVYDNNPRGRLRSLGLIDYPGKGMAVVCPVLFLAPHR